MTWVIRALLVLAIVILGAAALAANRPAASPPPAAAAATPVPPPPATPAPIATLVPTPRSSPTVGFVDRIISRISRETQVPYPTSTPRPANEGFVSVVDFSYLPSVLRIRVGQTVVWRNDGNDLHDVTGSDGWYSGAMEPFVEYRHVFGFEGIFLYQCSVHRDMHGTIIVTLP
jgi:plastocyanin